MSHCCCAVHLRHLIFCVVDRDESSALTVGRCECNLKHQTEFTLHNKTIQTKQTVQLSTLTKVPSQKSARSTKWRKENITTNTHARTQSLKQNKPNSLLYLPQTISKRFFFSFYFTFFFSKVPLNDARASYPLFFGIFRGAQCLYN